MVAGVYAIVHSESGRRYVGSSVNLRGRLSRHRKELDREIHGNRRLQRAWKKYGPAAFEFMVLETVSDRSALLAREQAHVDAASPRIYNVALVVASPMFGRKWSVRQHRKFSVAMKGHPVTAETRAKIGLGNSGKKLSDSQKALLLAANIGRKASAETRAKMSAARLGRSTGSVPLERRERISRTLTGRTLSPERVERAAASQRGRKQSPEWIARRTAYNFGNKYALGRKRSAEEVEKGAAKIRGRALSEEHRASLRAAWIRRKERAA